MTNKKTVIFLHIPKCGGTTLEKIIRRQFRPGEIFYRPQSLIGEGWAELAELSLAQKGAFRLVYIRHAPFGMHQSFPQRFSYVTMLRDPWRRMVSDYYHAARNVDHSFYVLASNGATLEDFVDYRTDRQQLTNPITRLISGINAMPPFAPLPDHALDIACANLQNCFGVAGTVERFDESLLLMKKHFGWGNVHYLRQNIGRNKPNRTEAGDGVKAKFAEANEMDCRLYAWVQERLEQQIEVAGSEFCNEVKRFQRWNRSYQTLFNMARRVKRQFFSLKI